MSVRKGGDLKKLRFEVSDSPKRLWVVLDREMEVFEVRGRGRFVMIDEV
jgi:hypothetical protein